MKRILERTLLHSLKLIKQLECTHFLFIILDSDHELMLLRACRFLKPDGLRGSTGGCYLHYIALDNAGHHPSCVNESL
jgi:hypothetical protein